MSTLKASLAPDRCRIRSRQRGNEAIFDNAILGNADIDLVRILGKQRRTRQCCSTAYLGENLLQPACQAEKRAVPARVIPICIVAAAWQT